MQNNYDYSGPDCIKVELFVNPNEPCFIFHCAHGCLIILVII